MRWFRRLITVGLALVLALLIGPVASRASLMDLMPQLEGQGSVEEQLNQTLEGKFELAKVRILGVPAISVASPVPLGDRTTIAASTRARVIEGNLRALYDPNQLCSFSERVSEWMLDSLLQVEDQIYSAGQRYGLARSGDPLALVGVLRLSSKKPQKPGLWRTTGS